MQCFTHINICTIFRKIHINKSPLFQFIQEEVFLFCLEGFFSVKPLVSLLSLLEDDGADDGTNDDAEQSAQ